MQMCESFIMHSISAVCMLRDSERRKCAGPCIRHRVAWVQWHKPCSCLWIGVLDMKRRCRECDFSLTTSLRNRRDDLRLLVKAAAGAGVQGGAARTRGRRWPSRCSGPAWSPSSCATCSSSAPWRASSTPSARRACRAVARHGVARCVRAAGLHGSLEASHLRAVFTSAPVSVLDCYSGLKDDIKGSLADACCACVLMRMRLYLCA